MRYLFDHKPRPWKIAAPLLVFLLALAIACGSAAAPADQQSAADPPAQEAASSGAAPTAAPTPAPASEVASTEIHPGKLTWMVGSFANERMTYCLAGGGGHDYGRQLHAFLIESGVENGARVLTPGLATDWGVSADGKTWTMNIREGAKFHDGSDMTIEDVLWSLKWSAGPQAVEYATGGGCLTQAQLIDTIEQTGPDEVSVTYKDTNLNFDSYFSAATGVWIGTVYPAGLGEGLSVLHDEAVEAAFDRNPVGAGPFRLVGHTAAESMQFERFDDYYYQPENGFEEDRRPRFTTLDLRLVQEVATRIAALRAGEADIAPVNLGAKEQVEAGGGRIIWGQEGAYFSLKFLGTWVEDFPFHDRNVRQALNYAIDRVAMRDRLFGGEEVMVLKGWMEVTPSSRGYSPELDPFPYDPEKARQMLADAGYPDGEGFGKLIIHTWPSVAVPNMPESAQLVAEMWRKELGIDAEVRVGEESGIKELTRLTEDAWGQILFRDNETELDPSDMMYGDYGNEPSRPDYATRDLEINALSAETRVIADPELRWPAVNAAYKRFRDESIEMSFGYINIPWGVGPRVLTWEPYPLAFYPTALHTITLAE